MTYESTNKNHYFIIVVHVLLLASLISVKFSDNDQISNISHKIFYICNTTLKS